MTEINQVVKAYRERHNLSLRKFADQINQHLINTDVTHQTVSRWESQEKPAEPDMRLLFECVATYTDWRAHFAVDCLRSMFPDLFTSGIVVINLPTAE
jgi:transcriptional regulator with XRE-family HTH domain